ncbi:MAG TPA: DUF6069 family protein [Candidatus Kapabacteria bacterium]|nr:DUF6069 family protein [Candidatus Kapabacteria bacterium]
MIDTDQAGTNRLRAVAVLRGGVYATITAILAIVVIRAVAVLFFKAPEDREILGLAQAAIAIVIGAVAATGTYLLLNLATRHARVVYSVLGIVFLLLSLLWPIGGHLKPMPNGRLIGTGVMIVLIGFHIVAGTILIVLLPRFAAADPSGGR